MSQVRPKRKQCSWFFSLCGRKEAALGSTKISGALVPLNSRLFNFTAGIQAVSGLSLLAKHTHTGTFYRESWGGFR